MPIHHANVPCDDCGQRHARDHQGECVEQLVAIVADQQAINANQARTLSRLRERFGEHQTALETCVEALRRGYKWVIFSELSPNDITSERAKADNEIISAALDAARKAVTE